MIHNVLILLTFLEYFKLILIKIVAILETSAKLASLDLVKIIGFSRPSYNF